MLEQRTKDIGGTKFAVTCIPGVKSRAMLVRLLKLVGPTIAKALKALDTTDVSSIEEFLDSHVGVGSLADGILEFSTRITEAEFEAVVQTFAEWTQMCTDSTNDAWVPMKEQLELGFAGKNMLLLKWLAFALEVNYSDFFGGSAKLKALAEAALSARKTSAKGSPSRNGSTGMSTESPAHNATAQA